MCHKAESATTSKIEILVYGIISHWELIIRRMCIVNNNNNNNNNNELNSTHALQILCACACECMPAMLRVVTKPWRRENIWGYSSEVNRLILCEKCEINSSDWLYERNLCDIMGMWVYWCASLGVLSRPLRLCDVRFHVLCKGVRRLNASGYYGYFKTRKICVFHL